MDDPILKLSSKLRDIGQHLDTAAPTDVSGRELEAFIAEAAPYARETLVAPVRRDAIELLTARLVPYLGIPEAAVQAERIFDKSKFGMGNDFLHLSSHCRREGSETFESLARKLVSIPELLAAFRVKYAAQLSPRV